MAAVAVLLLIAALSRAAVRRRLPIERLRRAVVAEALIGVVVGLAFLVWFVVLEGPAPTLAPQ